MFLMFTGERDPTAQFSTKFQHVVMPPYTVLPIPTSFWCPTLPLSSFIYSFYAYTSPFHLSDNILSLSPATLITRCKNMTWIQFPASDHTAPFQDECPTGEIQLGLLRRTTNVSKDLGVKRERQNRDGNV